MITSAGKILRREDDDEDFSVPRTLILGASLTGIYKDIQYCTSLNIKDTVLGLSARVQRRIRIVSTLTEVDEALESSWQPSVILDTRCDVVLASALVAHLVFI